MSNTDSVVGSFQNLARRLFDAQTGTGVVFQSAVQGLILISFVSFSVETLPGISAELRNFLDSVETATVLFFTFEYAMRLVSAERRWQYVFSFLGLVDLVAILPFYLTNGVDLRVVRGFRFLRLLQLFKLARYSRAMDRLSTAFADIRDELVLFFLASCLVLYLSAVGIYFFESGAQPENFRSVFHSLWWAVATLTTVGYGDVYPITVGGRLFTFAVLMVGLGVVGIPAGLLASSLSKNRETAME